MELSPRRQRILFAVCREYIVTGRAVASGALVQVHGLEWSPATIRNELVALEEAGFVSQPHQSAGRLPTPLGMRLYVRSLVRPPPLRPELRRAVDVSLSEPVHGPESMRVAAQVLSEVASCVAVTFVSEDRGGKVSQVDLVPVQGRRVMVALTLDGTHARLHPVTIDARFAEGGGLLRLQERLRGLCVGKTLAEARAELSRLWAEHEARLDRLLAESLRIGLWLCTAAALDPLWVQIAGQRLLAGQSDQTLAQVLALFDDYHGLAELLCQLLPEHSLEQARAEVHVAAELRPALAGVGPTGPCVLSGMSLIGCRVQPVEDGRTAAVALLGSDRMDYEAAIPLVEYAAQALAARTSE
ncbi:hypothetical protein [Nannocystis exedens]|uniref:hypothetical protein n=1 Tax=Nannocystis exedens TaxID=54 RepID=UPI000BBA0A55|nr:hypothetical protein [Nannocystis exedens]PCC67613.1 heat-inducible transcription repressor [Nannocystis exedens]